MKLIDKKRLKLYAVALSVLVLTGCGSKEEKVVDSREFEESSNVIEELESAESVVSGTIEIPEATMMPEESEIIPVATPTPVIETESSTTEEQSPDVILKEKSSEAIESLKNGLDTGLTKSKEVFILFVDFIFYEGVIAGKTFDELSDDVKADVLNSFYEFDITVESYIPGYKDTIAEYTEVVKDFFKSIPGFLENEWEEFKYSLDGLYQRFKGE